MQMRLTNATQHQAVIQRQVNEDAGEGRQNLVFVLMSWILIDMVQRQSKRHTMERSGQMVCDGLGLVEMLGCGRQLSQTLPITFHIKGKMDSLERYKKLYHQI